MLYQFSNPQNGRFYNILVHTASSGKLMLTIYRGGKKQQRWENIEIPDSSTLEKIIQTKIKRRHRNGYELIKSL